jgi:hypothetical protein
VCALTALDSINSHEKAMRCAIHQLRCVPAHVRYVINDVQDSISVAFMVIIACTKFVDVLCKSYVILYSAK